MSNVSSLFAPPMYAAAPTEPAAAADDAPATTATAAEVAAAKQYPPGTVEFENKGLKLGMQIGGGLIGLAGAAVLGMSLLSRGNAGGSRLLAAPLLIGSGLAAGGAGTALGAELLPSKKAVAVATGFPTEGKAAAYANLMTGRQTKIVQDVAGTFAVIDEGPVKNSAGYSYGQSHYYGDGHYHGQHYYGDGHNHNAGYYEPYYPGQHHDHHDYYPDYPTSSPDPWYPNPSRGRTSPGDDYPSSSGGSYPSNSGTSRGDDPAPSRPSTPSYNPPSYDPPSYSPPSYSPPSYSPPSYSPPSYNSGGSNSSSNGNPSDNDF